jgi:hypothetical protein
VQEAAPHADPRTTMRYDRARTSLGRHATLHRRHLHRRSGEVAPQRDFGRQPGYLPIIRGIGAWSLRRLAHGKRSALLWDWSRHKGLRPDHRSLNIEHLHPAVAS